VIRVAVPPLWNGRAKSGPHFSSSARSPQGCSWEPLFGSGCERPTQKSGIRSKTGVARLPKVKRVATMTEKCCNCNKSGQMELWGRERVGVPFLRTVPSPQIGTAPAPPESTRGTGPAQTPART
jgi:hypothetical protein